MPGANQVSGPSLFRADQSAQYRQALRAAYADARTKAVALADAAGASVGRVVALVEAGGATPLPATAERLADTTPIEPGTQEVQASVTVTFALQ